jgi:acyl-CoA thioesterase FadM
MQQDPFVPPAAAFTRNVPIRFSHCDPAGIVYFPHYFNMFNGVIEDWYTEELGYNYAELIMGSQFGFPFVHIECDFKIPSRMGDVIDLTLLVERVGRSSLGVAIVCHQRRRRAAARPHGDGDDVDRDRQAGRAAAGAARRHRGVSHAGVGLSAAPAWRIFGNTSGYFPD